MSPGAVRLKNILWDQLDVQGRMREKVGVVSGDCFGDSVYWQAVPAGVPSNRVEESSSTAGN